MPQLYCTLKNKRRLHIRPRYRTKHTYVVTRMKLCSSRSLLKGGNLARILGLTAVALLRATAIALPPLSFVRLWQCGAARRRRGGNGGMLVTGVHGFTHTRGHHWRPRTSASSLYTHTRTPRASCRLFVIWKSFVQLKTFSKRSIFTHFCGLLKKVH